MSSDAEIAVAPNRPQAGGPPAGEPVAGGPPAFRWTKPKIFGAIFGIAAAIIAYFIIPVGAPEALTAAMPNAFLPIELVPRIIGALSVWLIIYLIFTPIESGHAALIYMTCLLVLGVNSMSVLTYMAINPGWFQISAFIIAAAMMRSGLAKRLAYGIMHGLGANTPAKFMFAITFVGLVLILLVPSPIAMVGVLMPILLCVAEEWDIPARSALKKGIPALAICGVLICVSAIMGGLWTKTGFSQNLVALQIARIDIDWFQWFKIAAPTVWITAFLFVGVSVALFRPSKDIKASREVLKIKVQEMGRMTAVERNVLIIMVIVLILWATGTYTKVSPGWFAMAAVCVLAFPRIKLFKNFGDVTSTVVWPLLFFETALVALAGALGSTGISGAIANLLSGVQPHSQFGFYALSSIVGTFLTAVVGQNVVQAVIIPLFVTWGQAVNVASAQSFLAVWIPAGLGGHLFPTLIPTVLFAWTFKYKGEPIFTFKDGALLALVLFVVYYIVSIVSQMTFWPVI